MIFLNPLFAFATELVKLFIATCPHSPATDAPAVVNEPIAAFDDSILSSNSLANSVNIVLFFSSSVLLFSLP